MVLRLLLIALAINGLSPGDAQAQIVADPKAPSGQRPTVLRAANGVPQVNVQTPSAAGVSRNAYRQFDVDSQGVILNNSRTDTPTELGGWIQGNPWLARGPARILLNEINSGDPSRLAGRVEVAGSRAEVVIANPSGISCSGCGFINASRATLTTGTPVMSEGALQSFRVQGGSLSIDGKGLDVKDTDYAVLLGRTVKINARVHAKNLAVVAGMGEATATGSLDSPGAIAPISGASPVPRVLLDVSALGSVYAGKIFLVGTEAGLGVVQAGQVIADDELTLSTQGWLTQSGRLQAGNTLRVTASSVDNTRGKVIGADVAIDASGGVVLNDAGVIAATQQLRVESASVNNSGGRIVSDGALRLRTSDLSNTRGWVGASGDLALEVATFSNRDTQARDLGVQGRSVSIRAQSVDNDAGVILADEDLWLATGATLANGTGLMVAGRRLQLDAGDLSLARGARLVSDGAVQITLERDFSNRGLVDGADVRIDAKTVSNQGTGRLFGDRLAIGAETLSNDTETIAGVREDAVIAARERLDIGVRELINREHALIYSAGTRQDALSIGGSLDAQGRATGAAAHVVNRSATIESLGGLRLDAQRLDNTNAHFSTAIEETLAPTSRQYIQPQGGAMLPAELFVWEGWSRAGRYRFRTDPTAGSAAVLGQSPIPRVGEQTCTGDDDQEVCTRVLGADYPAGHAAWMYFAQQAPDPEPGPPTLRAPAPPSADRAGTCVPGPAQDAVACQAYTDELAAYQVVHGAYTQAWTDYAARRSAWQAQTDTRYALLDDRIEVYNAGFAGRYIQNWTQYAVTRTERETRVLSSDPGRILSGGDMRLRGGDLVNDKSQIVAGGALTGDLLNLRTVDAEGVHIVSESGTSQYTASRWRGGTKRYHQRDWAAVAPYAPADEVMPIVLPVAHRRSQVGAAAGVGASRPIEVRSAPVAGNSVGQPVRTLTSATSLPLPSSGLFRATDDPISPYFFEADPRFTERSLWLESQPPSPSSLFKRLGDAFYEQQLIRDQVLRLTGQRFLVGFSSDDAQYQALIQAGTTFAQTQSLRPGVALTDAQMAQLTSDMVWLVLSSVTLPDGRTVQALVPQVYVVVRPGDLTDTGSLLAGQSVDLQLSGDLTNTGVITGRKRVVIQAENLRNLGGRVSGQEVALSAESDLANLGGEIRAGTAMTVQAGRDLRVESTVRTRTAQAGQSSGERTHIDRLAGLYVTDPGGSLLATAQRDLVIKGAQVMTDPPQSGQAAGQTVILAGRDLRLESVQVSNQTNTVADARNFIYESSQRDVGSEVRVGGDLVMSAGRDLGAQAARIETQTGAVLLQAGRDIEITAGQAREQRDEAHQTTHRGLLSSTTHSTRDTLDATRALETTVSAEEVRLVAGQDMTVKGSQVVSTGGTSATAGRRLVIEAAAESRRETHDRKEARSGVFGSGGVGFTIGKRDAQTRQARSEIGLAPSTVGSTAGSVVLAAGDSYRQEASEVVALQGNVSIAAREIAIVDGTELVRTEIHSKHQQSGVTVAITNPVITAAQTTQQMAQAAGDTRDPRMRALAAATTALAIKRAAEAVKAQPDTAGGVGVSVSIGASQSSSESTRTVETPVASRVVAQGNLTLRAEGAGERSSLVVQGSDLQSGGDALMVAEGEVSLVAAAQRTQAQSTQRSSGVSLGVGMALGKKTQASTPKVGITLGANAARGESAETEVVWRNTQVQAQGRATLESGRDTRLRGAVVEGQEVVVRAGGDLAMESLQGTETYQETQHSVGGSVTVGAGSGASLSLGKSQIDSTFVSVDQQTALRSGDAGFDVRVQGNAVLRGAAVTSTDAAVQAGRNRFEASQIATHDLVNQAHYEAMSVGISLGAGKDPQGKLAAQGTGGGYGSDAQSAQSVTRAGVSGIAGHQEVRTGDAPTGLRPIFDADRVQREIRARVTITAAMGIEARKAIDAYVGPRKAELRQRRKDAKSAEEIAQVAKEIKRIELEERVMTILVGAVTGQGGSAAMREALGAASQEMRALMISESRKFKGVTDGVTTLSNESGISQGVDGDGFKLGGSRVSLELVCGEGYKRCEKSKETGELILDSKQRVIFIGDTKKIRNLEDFLASEDGKKMAGITGGVQGAEGTLYGIPYAPGSWIDGLVESFAGAHDMIGGKVVGVYNEKGNIKDQRGPVVGRIQDYWSLTGAVIASSPFAMSTLLPSDVWTAISIFLRAAR